MKAADFFEDFTSKLYTEPGIVKAYWSPLGAFTDIVTKVIQHIIKSNEFSSSKEYLRIDVTGWKSRSKEVANDAKKFKMKPHLWDLMIAVEHENDTHDWSDEVIKLLHIRCPLKVVIGYNDSNKRGTDLDKLALVATWMEQTEAIKGIHDAESTDHCEEFLIILGNCGKQPNTTDQKKSFDYRGYLYNSQKQQFEQI